MNMHAIYFVNGRCGCRIFQHLRACNNRTYFQFRVGGIGPPKLHHLGRIQHQFCKPWIGWSVRLWFKNFVGIASMIFTIWMQFYSNSSKMLNFSHSQFDKCNARMHALQVLPGCDEQTKTTTRRCEKAWPLITITQLRRFKCCMQLS